MKVLIVGAEEIYSLENYYIKYLKEIGVEVHQFSSQRMFYQYYNAPIRKILFRLRLSSIYKRINERLRTIVVETNPRLVWIFKGMEILPETLQWIHQRKIKLINYNPDNPFIFSGKGSGNSNVTQCIPYYDLHLTYNTAVKKQLEQVYHSKVEIVPFGFDCDDTIYQACLLEDEIIKACFVGNPDRERAEFLKKIADSGVELSIYGIGWDRFLNHSNIEFLGPVYLIEQWRVLRKYRVQLNLMRTHNLDSHNMRTFEVPGIGGIMVAIDTFDHRLFFEDGKEAFFFKDVDQCVQIIHNLIRLPSDQAMKIRNAARNRSVRDGYSYKHRAKQVLKIMETLMS